MSMQYRRVLIGASLWNQMKPRSLNPLPETAGEVITILSDFRLYGRGRDTANFGHHLGQMTWINSIICPIEAISFSLGKSLNVFIKCRTNLDMYD